jgi:hypothetical protein
MREQLSEETARAVRTAVLMPFPGADFLRLSEREQDVRRVVHRVEIAWRQWRAVAALIECDDGAWLELGKYNLLPETRSWLADLGYVADPANASRYCFAPFGAGATTPNDADRAWQACYNYAQAKVLEENDDDACGGGGGDGEDTESIVEEK